MATFEDLSGVDERYADFTTIDKGLTDLATFCLPTFMTGAVLDCGCRITLELDRSGNLSGMDSHSVTPNPMDRISSNALLVFTIPGFNV